MDVKGGRVALESGRLLRLRQQHRIDISVELLLDQRPELILDNMHDLRLAAFESPLKLRGVFPLLFLLFLGDLSAAPHV